MSNRRTSFSRLISMIKQTWQTFPWTLSSKRAAKQMEWRSTIPKRLLPGSLQVVKTGLQVPEVVGQRAAGSLPRRRERSPRRGPRRKQRLRRKPPTLRSLSPKKRPVFHRSQNLNSTRESLSTWCCRTTWESCSSLILWQVSVQHH